MPTPGLLEMLILAVFAVPVVIVVVLVKLVKRARKPPGQEDRAAEVDRTGWR